MNENELSNIIIAGAIEVHRVMGGPGLLESVYEEALAYELEARGLSVNRQVDIPLLFKGRHLKTNLRLDILVNDIVIVECKSMEQTSLLHRSQLLTYLRLTGLKLGLLINFGQTTLKDGIHRVVNGL